MNEKIDIAMQDSSTPTPTRQRELLEVWQAEIYDPGNFALRHPTEYHSWDDVIECTEDMSYDEWRWCGDNFEVKVQVIVSRCSVSDNPD